MRLLVALLGIMSILLVAVLIPWNERPAAGGEPRQESELAVEVDVPSGPNDRQRIVPEPVSEPETDHELGNVLLRHVRGKDCGSTAWKLIARERAPVRVEADAQGRLRLPPGWWSLEALGSGLVVVAGAFEVVQREELTLWIDDAIALEVVVLDRSSRLPIAGAHVSWTHGRADGWTDEEGLCRFESLAPAGSGRLLVASPGYLLAERPLTRERFESGRVEIDLHRASRDLGFAVRFLDTKGAPCAGVKAFGQKSEEGVQTRLVFLGESDRSGRLELPDWCKELRRIDVGGAAFPGHVEMEASPLLGGKEVAVTIQRPLHGRLTILPPAGDDVESCLVSVRFPVEPGPGVVHPSGWKEEIARGRALDVELPRSTTSQVTVVGPCGALWQAEVLFEEEGWNLECPLERAPGTRLEILTNAEIDRVEIGSLPVACDLVPIPGGIALIDVPPRPLIRLHTAEGGKATLSYGRPRGCGEAGDASLRIEFPPLVPLHLRLRTSDGRPLGGVGVVVSGYEIHPSGAQFFGPRIPLPPDGCWEVKHARSSTVFSGDGGEVSLRLPPGWYHVRLFPPDWWETTAFSWEPTEGADILVGPEGVDRDVVVPGIRRIVLRLGPRIAGLDGWLLWEPNRRQGNVLGGGEVAVRITEEAYAFEVQTKEREVITTFEVPPGSGDLEIDVP